METRTRRLSRYLTVMALWGLTLASGCQESNSPQQTITSPSPSVTAETSKINKTKVVVTFLPMYLFTKAVAGNSAEVDLLVPPGTDIHDYQAKPDNVKAIATANVLVKNGLGLEEFLTDTIKNAENSQLKLIDASKGIKTLKEISAVEEVADEKDHDHDHSQGNPHVWLDPLLAKQQVTNIRDGLIAADPSNKATYEANASAYIQELDKLHQEFQQTLQTTPQCKFITFHDAFPYLATRYNLSQIAVVEIPEDQLSPADVQKAVNAVKKYKVKALFSEPGIDNKLLKSLAQDLQLNVQTLDSLETGDTNPQYYFKAMRANLQTLATGCK